jgi:hypothetical protein
MLHSPGGRERVNEAGPTKDVAVHPTPSRRAPSVLFAAALVLALAGICVGVWRGLVLGDRADGQQAATQVLKRQTRHFDALTAHDEAQRKKVLRSLAGIFGPLRRLSDAADSEREDFDEALDLANRSVDELNAGRIANGKHMFDVDVRAAVDRWAVALQKVADEARAAKLAAYALMRDTESGL